MIQAILSKVLFARNMTTGEVTTDAIIFQIPDGPEVFAQATPELVKYIENFSPPNDEEPEEYYEPDRLEPAPPVDQVPQMAAPQNPVIRDPNTEVEWEQLPEDILGTHYKIAMKSLGNIKPVLTWALLEQMVNAIDREFTEEMWARLGLGDTGPVPEEAPSQIVGGGLKVNVDVAGNPRAQVEDDTDPGERVADDDDEEDAAQF